MSATPCGRCGRPVPDAFVCASCSFKVDEALSSIGAYQGLAWDLTATLTRQDRIGDRNSGSRSAEKPLPFKENASDASQRLLTVLRYWANRIVQETGADPAPANLAPLAVWLRPRVGWLRHHQDGAKAFGAILDAVHEARRVIDRPPDLMYAGPCGAALEDGECVENLYAFPGAAYVTCRGCDTSWDVHERRTWLLTGLDDYLANSQQMARLMGYLGVTVPDSTIRYYAHKGRIAAHGKDDRSRPLYRLGDVVRTYFETQKAS